MVNICRESDLKQSEVEKWKKDFLAGGEESLKAKPIDKGVQEIKELRAKVGELTLELPQPTFELRAVYKKMTKLV